MAVPSNAVLSTPVQQGMPAMGMPSSASMGLPPGVSLGMPPGMVMGTPANVGMGMPVTGLPSGAIGLQSVAAPRMVQCQVQVPKGLEPGETFITSTPDGQQLELTVPMDSEPGATMTFSYMPLTPASTVVGMPIGMAPLGMGGLSSALEVLAAGGAEAESERQDRQHSELGWVLYCVGWALCLCCGPVGPAFWFGVACMHWCKPKMQRERLPREHAVAVVSLWTGAIGIVVTLVLSLALAATAHSRLRGGAAQQDDKDDYGSNHHRNGHW